MDTSKPAPSSALPSGDDGAHSLPPNTDSTDSAAESFSPSSPTPVPPISPSPSMAPISPSTNDSPALDDETDLGPEIDPTLQEVIDKAAKDLEASKTESVESTAEAKTDEATPEFENKPLPAPMPSVPDGTPVAVTDDAIKPSSDFPKPSPSLTPFAPLPPLPAANLTDKPTEVNSSTSTLPITPTASSDTKPLTDMSKPDSATLSSSSIPSPQPTLPPTPSLKPPTPTPSLIPTPKSSTTDSMAAVPTSDNTNPSASTAMGAFPPLPPMPGFVAKPDSAAVASTTDPKKDDTPASPPSLASIPKPASAVSESSLTPSFPPPPKPNTPPSVGLGLDSKPDTSDQKPKSDESPQKLSLPPLPSTTPPPVPSASPTPSPMPSAAKPTPPPLSPTMTSAPGIPPLPGGSAAKPPATSDTPQPTMKPVETTSTNTSPTTASGSDSGKPKKGLSKKLMIAIAGFVIILVGLVVGLIVLQMSQDVRQQAFDTAQSAQAQCLGDGQIALTVSFSNNAPEGSDNSVRVTARDSVSQTSIELGVIAPGQSKADKITISGTSVAGGQVVFEITGVASGEVTSATANYSALTCQVSCPVEPTSTGVIMSHSEFLRSDQSEAQAMATKNLTLPAGTYSVSLTSYDKHSTENAGQAQKREQYFVIFKDAEGNELARSGTISDLEEDKDFKTEIVNQALEIPGLVTTATFYHAAYPDTSTPNSVYPLCAVVNPVDVEPEPSPSPATSPSPVPSPSPSPKASPTPGVTPAPTPSPTPAPTPTPVTNYCNTTCSQTSDCNRYDSNLVCHNSQCRRNDNLGDSTCTVPVKIACNSECVDNNGCSTLGSQYSCVQGNCRLTAYPNRADCSLPPSPTPTSVSQVTGGLAPSPQPTMTQDLPEAGSILPTAAALTIGFLILILGAGILLVP